MNQEDIVRDKGKTIQFKNDDMDELDVFRNQIVIEEEEKLKASIIE